MTATQLIIAAIFLTLGYFLRFRSDRRDIAAEIERVARTADVLQGMADQVAEKEEIIVLLRELTRLQDERIEALWEWRAKDREPCEN